MVGFKGIDQLREIDWDKTYLWDILLEDPSDPIPFPFNDFFPAIEVEEEGANLLSFEFESAGGNFKVPHKSASRTLSLTFPDNHNKVLYSYFVRWIESKIFNQKEFVSTLDESVKQITILKKDVNGFNVSTNAYWVYPEDKITYRGTSESSLSIYTVSLVIAGIIRQEEAE